MVDQNFKTWLDDAERLLTFAERAKEEFVKGSLQKKRSIMSALGSEHLLDSGVLTIKTEKPLLLMREMASAESRFEPLTSVGNNGYFDENDPEFSQRWRCGESNSGPNPVLRASLRRVVSIKYSEEA